MISFSIVALRNWSRFGRARQQLVIDQFLQRVGHLNSRLLDDAFDKGEDGAIAYLLQNGLDDLLVAQLDKDGVSEHLLCRQYASLQLFNFLAQLIYFFLLTQRGPLQHLVGGNHLLAGARQL